MRKRTPRKSWIAHKRLAEGGEATVYSSPLREEIYYMRN
jgi:hypothetical protein